MRHAPSMVAMNDKYMKLMVIILFGCPGHAAMTSLMAGLTAGNPGLQPLSAPSHDEVSTIESISSSDIKPFPLVLQPPPASTATQQTTATERTMVIDKEVWALDWRWFGWGGAAGRRERGERPRKLQKKRKNEQTTTTGELSVRIRRRYDLPTHSRTAPPRCDERHARRRR